MISGSMVVYEGIVLGGISVSSTIIVIYIRIGAVCCFLMCIKSDFGQRQFSQQLHMLLAPDLLFSVIMDDEKDIDIRFMSVNISLLG